MNESLQSIIDYAYRYCRDVYGDSKERFLEGIRPVVMNAMKSCKANFTMFLTVLPTETIVERMVKELRDFGVNDEDSPMEVLGKIREMYSEESKKLSDWEQYRALAVLYGYLLYYKKNVTINLK